MHRANVEHVSTLAVEVYTAAVEYLSQFGRPGGIPPSEDANPNPMTTAEVVSCAFLLSDKRLTNLAWSGIEYLLDSQTRDGCWTDPDAADSWDVSSTAWSVSAMLTSGMKHCDHSVERGCDWLRASVLASGGLPTNRRHTKANTYATAYGIRALAQAGDYTTAARCARFIEGSQNGDGGWGLACGDLSDLTLTSHVVHGLQDAGAGANRCILSALGYLLDSPRTAGVWPSWFEPSPSVEGTAFCSYVLFRSMRIDPQDVTGALSFLVERIRRGTAWRVAKRNRPWIAVSCILLAAAVLDARRLTMGSNGTQMIEAALGNGQTREI